MNLIDHHPVQRLLAPYFSDVLGVRIDSEPWPEADRLPLYLKGSYSFSVASVLGVRLLLMVERTGERHTPAVLKKHMDQVGRRWAGDIVYVRESIDSHNRQRLIRQQTPFVVPGNQMYLPFLGVDLREYYRKNRGLGRSFSPSTQATLIYVLNMGSPGPLSPLEMSRRLGYAAMTMSRVFDELRDAEIGEHSVRGKRRLIEFPASPRAYWEKARPLLRTPVLRRRYVAGGGGATIGPSAGLTALSLYTSLAAPRVAVIAASGTGWAHTRDRAGLAEINEPDPDSVQVELWSYRPELTAAAGKVDRLSLFLSLKDTVDERVEGALEQLLAGLEW